MSDGRLSVLTADEVDVLASETFMRLREMMRFVVESTNGSARRAFPASDGDAGALAERAELWKQWCRDLRQMRLAIEQLSQYAAELDARAAAAKRGPGNG